MNKALTITRGKKELYYNIRRKDDFKWFEQDGTDVPHESYRRVGIPLILAYGYGTDTDYVKKRLGELDELFYRLINSSKIAKRLNYIDKLEKQVVNKVNKTMKYTKVLINKENYDITIGMYLGISKINVENRKFNVVNWEEKEKYVQNFLEKEEYGVENVYSVSDDEAIFMNIGENDLNKWEGFIKGVVELDKKLQDRTGNKLMYAIGEEVMLKKHLKHDDYYNGIYVSRAMENLNNRRVEIGGIVGDKYTVKNTNWKINDELIDHEDTIEIKTENN